MSTKQRIIIVGGGPAGAATAKALADMKDNSNSRLFTVQLYEAYPHPDKIHKNNAAAYVIALGGRGQGGFEKATGLDPTKIPGSVVSVEMVRHPSLSVRNHKASPSLIIPRKVLAGTVLNQAADAGVAVYLEHRLVDLDLIQKVATFETKRGATKKVPYDLLVGSDGSKSAVRQLLHDQADDFSVLRTEQDSMEYQVTVIPTMPFDDLPATAVHAWNNKEYNSICLGFPLADNKGLLFALVFPVGKLAEFRKQHEVDGTGYNDALAAVLPDLSEATKTEMIKQLTVGQVANGGTCVWASALGSFKHGVALVGDSGHGMWPSLGQGANCALESVAVFCEAVKDIAEGKVESSFDSWSETVVREFNKRRYADAIAAVDLTYGGIGARTARGRGNSPLSYKLQIAGMMLLNKITMGVVPKPALLRLMVGDSISYTTARRMHFYVEQMICLGALSLPVLAWYLPKYLRKS